MTVADAKTIESQTEVLNRFVPVFFDIGRVGNRGRTVVLDTMGMLDIDNQATVFIPRQYIEGEDDMKSWFRENSSIKEIGLTEQQKERMRYCVEVLKLPELIAVDLTFNQPERDLGDFVIPEASAKVPKLLGVCGESGQGKSTMIAVLTLRYSYGHFNMDRFSDRTVDEYLTALKEAGVTGETTIEEVCRIIGQTRLKEFKVKEPKTLKQVLGELTEMFVDGRRPGWVLCDLPGSEEGRPMDVFDMLPYFGLSSISIERNREREFPDSVRDYIEQFERIKDENGRYIDMSETAFGQCLRNKPDDKEQK